MKFGVVVFPGSNCEDDTVFALKYNLGQEVVKIWHKDHDLQNCDFIFLPGGFSYGDYLRSGAIARFSPVMNEVIAHANRGGYVMGICNGFQILAEAGLVPGVLLKNTTQKYICKNIYLKPQSKSALLTAGLEERAYKVPIAHGDGRYFADEDTIKALNDNDQVLFRYCNEAGVIEDSANPNGSLQNIAGVTNKGKNVFGMMPHPERAADGTLGNTDGYQILEQILNVLV
ncbi:phosphoribosylformylglycinamidine synthase subunit PurQ [Leadbetterella byssophila]|uniref:Phosphoribosylformylglycinamidine synthase subunit PurQ n=1 Tax=Leadbetterella byssophila (strain DSM 17132 / JCM 16389 / KACC 11308 / NBRC 106382 / 4M15) TaxID=649349 RepID=E4RUJ2_LEAB4|nr:phosphoribosylformylglycinamidine synthase subunit PurQ [Leadbetterella byssophila]ADQ18728.1 phosphoribosylformylglycinamidine synthase subunit I [Leadbetterella byssophila DSM 17132]